MARRRAHAAAIATPGPWIVGPWQDALFFIGTPLLILPALLLLRLRFSAESIWLAVAALGAQGHHLPGMLRAYGDRELFRRYRVRFIAAPILLVAVCWACRQLGLEGLELLMFLWAWWHGLAQVYGFMRIYDAKAGGASRRRATLDLATCVVWFAGALLFAPDKLAQILGALYASGGPVLPAGAIGAARAAWGVVAVAVTATFVATTLADWRRGAAPSLPKLMLIASSFAFWWVATVFIRPTILGVAAFEIFHDVQYLAIVWVFNRSRVDAGKPVGPVTRFLFRPRPALVALYVGLVLAYGWLGSLDLARGDDDLRLTIYGLVAASALLHYYFDGFIWKIREPATSAALGMAGGGTKPTVVAHDPWFRHGLRWCGFVVPALVLFAAQACSRVPALAQKQAVAAAVPDSANARQNLGVEFHRLGRHEEAVAEFAAAVRLDPEFAKAHLNWGTALTELGRGDEAVAHFREARRLDPGLDSVSLSWGNTLLALGRPREALERFEEAVLRLGTAEAHNNLANALGSLGRAAEAEQHYAAALARNPRYLKAHVNWGNALSRQRRFRDAIEHYQAAHAIDPQAIDPQLYWGLALLGLGDVPAARARLAAVLVIAPGHPVAAPTIERIDAVAAGDPAPAETTPRPGG